MILVVHLNAIFLEKNTTNEDYIVVIELYIKLLKILVIELILLVNNKLIEQNLILVIKINYDLNILF